MSAAPGVSALDHVLVLSDDIERSREFNDPDRARVEINIPANDRRGG